MYVPVVESPGIIWTSCPPQAYVKLKSPGGLQRKAHLRRTSFNFVGQTGVGKKKPVHIKTGSQRQKAQLLEVVRQCMIMMKTRPSIFDRWHWRANNFPKPEFCYKPRTNIYTNSLTSHVEFLNATHFQCVWEPGGDKWRRRLCVSIFKFMCDFRIIVADWPTAQKKTLEV